MVPYVNARRMQIVKILKFALSADRGFFVRGGADTATRMPSC